MNWQEIIDAYFSSDKGRALWAKVEEAYHHQVVYPPRDQLFRAFDLTPIETVRVVILGQDPYHQANQANGLAFSVDKGQALPPSLRNIYRELVEDLQIAMPQHGDLSGWTQQGVLLLNTSLTVEANKANAHKDLGWQDFTDYILSVLNERSQPIIFLLWGKQAQAKKSILTNPHHHLIESVHPSPLSAYRGFFGSRPFSKINSLIEEEAIEWQIK